MTVRRHGMIGRDRSRGDIDRKGGKVAQIK